MLKIFIVVALLLTQSISANDRALKRLSMQTESRVALIIGNNSYRSDTLKNYETLSTMLRLLKRFYRNVSLRLSIRRMLLVGL